MDSKDSKDSKHLLVTRYTCPLHLPAAPHPSHSVGSDANTPANLNASIGTSSHPREERVTNDASSRTTQSPILKPPPAALDAVERCACMCMGLGLQEACMIWEGPELPGSDDRARRTDLPLCHGGHVGGQISGGYRTCTLILP